MADAKCKGGGKVKVGDKVTVEFEVTGVTGNQLSLKSCEVDPNASNITVTCDACCCEKCEE